MSRNISLQEAGSRWVKNSLRSYLEGEKNLKWIAGILKGTSKEEIQSLFDSLGRSKERRNFRNGSIGPTFPARQTNAPPSRAFIKYEHTISKRFRVEKVGF